MLLGLLPAPAGHCPALQPHLLHLLPSCAPGCVMEPHLCNGETEPLPLAVFLLMDWGPAADNSLRGEIPQSVPLHTPWAHGKQQQQQRLGVPICVGKCDTAGKCSSPPAARGAEDPWPSASVPPSSLLLRASSLPGVGSLHLTPCLFGDQSLSTRGEAWSAA